MRNFFYTKSPKVTTLLQEIDSTRTTTLTHVHPLQTELELQWRASINRIYYSFLITGRMVSDKQIELILNPFSAQEKHQYGEQITNYKQLYDYLYLHWYANPDQVRAEDISFLYHSFIHSSQLTNIEEIERVLLYIQSSREHPLIQASIAPILILSTNASSIQLEQLARATLLVFLYKYGYDFKRMLVLEQFFFESKTRSDLLFQKYTRKEDNLNEWLEFMLSGILTSAEYVVANVNRNAVADDYHELTELNDRQRQILTLLDPPGTSITNRDVQKKYKVSQITASRDLSRLTALGLLFANGKGRSIYYTRV